MKNEESTDQDEVTAGEMETGARAKLVPDDPIDPAFAENIIAQNRDVQAAITEQAGESGAKAVALQEELFIQMNGQKDVEASFEAKPPIKERLSTEERFRTYKTAELINDLVGGVEALRQQVKSGGESGEGLTEQEIQKIYQAVNLAIELHIDQKDRPSGEPYINHVLNVARRVVAEYGVTNPSMIMAAALHDSVEDQSVRIAEMNQGAEGDEREKSLGYIATNFGERVSDIVHSLSNEEVPDGLDTQTKNRIYVEHVTEAVQDPEVALIKLADFSDNALTLEKISDPKRRVKLTEKYMPVVAMFIDRIQKEDIRMSEKQKSNLVAKLTSVHGEMESYLRDHKE